MNEVLLIEIDDDTVNKQLNEVERWFEHVLTTQMAFELQIKQSTPKIKEPHIKEALERMYTATKHHTKTAEQLFQVINKSADEKKDTILAVSSAAIEKGLMIFQETLAGAVGSWRELHHLLLLNQQAMGAFAVAEQLGLSLGIKEIVLLTFKVAHEKTMHQLLLQEYMLEMAPISILYKESI